MRIGERARERCIRRCCLAAAHVCAARRRLTLLPARGSLLLNNDHLSRAESFQAVVRRVRMRACASVHCIALHCCSLSLPSGSARPRLLKRPLRLWRSCQQSKGIRQGVGVLTRCFSCACRCCSMSAAGAVAARGPAALLAALPSPPLMPRPSRNSSTSD